MDGGTFTEEQRAYWSGADVDHFQWQTRGAYIAETEAELLDHVDVDPGERLLEIGCGEGANLHHLRGRGARLFGIDFMPAKARFAAAETGASTACADAQKLPFADGAFDAVFIRDLLHHVPRRQDVLVEAYRVLRSGGRLTVIEPNRTNPLIALQAAAIPAERGMLVSTGRRLLDEISNAGFIEGRLDRAQPLPISRALLHYKHGAPQLAARPPVAALIRGLERALEVLPGPVWAYLIAHGRKS